MSTIVLPDIYMITGNDLSDEKFILKRLQNCLLRGISFIQLRLKELTEKEYKLIANKAILLCREYNAKLLLNSDVSLINELNADGIHLSSHKLLNYLSRPLSKNKIIGASCHNLNELRHAEKIGVDFVTLSPILATTSHPEAEHLGWSKFSELLDSISIPVFALGGVNLSHMQTSKEYGAFGIAAISAFWRD